MANLAGQYIGNYHLLGLLGHGGQAEVYLGEHLYLHRQTAIKILQTSLNEKDTKRFLLEAQLLADLSHPHIVRVLDFAVEQGTPYLVMDYAPGGSLRKLHPTGSRLPLRKIIAYMKQIASALQYAHDHKIIHRDIKPENILLNAEHNHIMLSDFGLALLAPTSELLSTQALEGTIPYMAPEQLRGKPTFASDQYALGIMTYNWLAGGFPFQGAPWEIITQHLSTPPPPLRTRQANVSPAIEDVVMLALQKEPQQRYASVEAFAQALEAAAYNMVSAEKLYATTPALSSTPTQKSTEIVSSQNGPTDQRVGKHLSRRNAIIGLVGATAIAGGALGLADWLQNLQKAQHTLANPATNMTTMNLAHQKTPVASPSTTQTLPLIYHGHTNGVTSAVWSPNGTQIASASSDTTVQIWGANDGAKVLTYKGHSALVWVAVWSPDGKRIASGSKDGTVRVRNILSGEILTYQAPSTIVHTVSWSPDGKYIASAGDKTVQIWDSTTGKAVYTYQNHTGGVEWVSWSPNKQLIASASDDQTVQIWQAFGTK